MDSYRKAEQRLTALVNRGSTELLKAGLIGLEKESLRVAPAGGISGLSHPQVFGSPLTHPYLTTDYSEALLEIITPPLDSARAALQFLQDAHKFVYQGLGEETLWATSMPCVLSDPESIPIAQYGPSNAGVMKTVYRRGLGHRYGKVMQVIAGAHFNYSVPMALWPVLQEIDGDRAGLRAYIDDRYFGLIRNLLRWGWLVPYLFGASPAVCKSFLGGRPTRLPELDAGAYYQPYACSLRMGDIGYQNSKELGTGVKANYDGLQAYLESLVWAIETPCPEYERIGVKVNGRYEQLNANILQIENEYYSSVRPKQTPDGYEKPSLALQRRGVGYIELRSLDVNAFDPLGISEPQVRFLEAFLLFCLLAESPPINIHERQEIDRNQGGVAHRGRDPNLYLQRNGRELKLRDWAGELLDGMTGVCELLDAGRPDSPYRASLAQQWTLVEDPDLTPSARMLAEMRSRGESFFPFSQRLSEQHREWFEQLSLSPERERLFREEAERSWQRQAEIEAGDDISFDEFLARYFAQA